MREQDPRRGTCFMAGILADNGIDRTADEETPCVLSEFVADPDDLAGPPRGFERRGDAAVPSATARPMTVADAHALADRLERAGHPQSDQATAAKLIRALLRGRVPSDQIGDES